MRLARRLAERPWIFSIVFALGVVSHTLALASPNASDTSPPWRHALFLGINASLAIAFAIRFRWTIVPCFALLVQQTLSHGSDLVEAARARHLDLASVLVLLVMPWCALGAWGLASREPVSCTSRSPDT